MDGATFELPLFLLATFAGAFVAGLSGFAFGLVAASLWLYVLTPLQSATLIVGFGLLVQGYSVWKLRGALNSAQTCALHRRRHFRRSDRRRAFDLVRSPERPHCRRHFRCCV